MCECGNRKLGIGVTLTLFALRFKKTQTQTTHINILNTNLFQFLMCFNNNVDLNLIEN